jgi:uncharacterized protein (TIGR03435 family)
MRTLLKHTNGRLPNRFQGVFFLVVLGGVSAAYAQTSAVAGAAPLQFEVATIKPSPPSAGCCRGLEVYPGGRVVIWSAGLKALVHTAFDEDWWQISDGPDSVAKDSYDIVAKAPETSPPTVFSLRHSLFELEDPRLRQMLQALLIDRFQLRFHRETKTGPVLLLVKSGKPILLHANKMVDGKDPHPDGFAQVGWAGDWNMFNVTMPQLAKFASGYALHQTVLDKTGLDGSFDYRSKLSLTSPQNGDDVSFRFFLEEIGLKLVPSTGPVETFVIDHAEPPSPN